METELIGEVKSIVFSNPMNGYSVVEILSEGRKYTITGIFPPISEGQNIRVTGKFQNKGIYGKQFAADKIFVYQPSRIEGIRRFLGSKLIKGLGPVTAEAIVDKYGVDTLEKMKYPLEIAKVKGISLKKATEFCMQFSNLQKMQESMIFLQQLGMTINLALKIYSAYGDKTQDIVSKNPYQLVYDIDGVGFYTADVIAEKLGVEKNSDFRIRAAISYVLKDVAAKKGHNYLPENELIANTIDILKSDSDEITEKVQQNINDLELFGDLIKYNLEEHTAILLRNNYNTELSIAKNLLRLQMQAQDFRVDIDNEVNRFEQEQGFTLHENQRAAVKAAVENGVQVVTGGPGTGKTTIIKCILKLFMNLKQRVALCAPTGRAAKRLSEATGEEAKTIHRLLGLDWREGNTYFQYDDEQNLPFDVIIMDEVSMVDEYVFNGLLKAMAKGSRLVLVGDKDQLASVGAGNVLSDIISCGKFPVSYLTQIYRQSEKSKIVPNAHKINKGEMPELDNNSDDFFFEEKESAEEILKTTLNLITKRLPQYRNVKPIDIQVLAPMKKGIAGTYNLNKEIQKVINPYSPLKREIRHGDFVFREGDKVMQMANNYRQEWTQMKGSRVEVGLGVYNGDIGYIESINNALMQFTIRFDDDKVAVYENSDIDQLSLAYAVTIHKSQGSEFDDVVLALDTNYLLQTRNLLYTAVTRAKKLVVMVGAKKTIARMIRNNETARRYSLLVNLIDECARKDM